MIHKLCALTTCVVLACAIHTAVPSGPTATRTSVERFQEARSERDLARAYRDLFINATIEQLRRLAEDPDACIALGSQWELVRRTIPEGELMSTVQPDQEAISDFLSLVRTRLGIPIPEFWATSIRLMKSNGRNYIWFAMQEVRQASSQSAKDGKRSEISGKAFVRKEGDHLLASMGDNTWVLPRGSHSLPADAGSAELGDNAEYLVLYWSRFPMPYRLYAIDRDSRKVTWSADVWAGTDLVIYSGHEPHIAQLKLHGQNLIVFGVSYGTAYIEVFDALTGKNVCRFGTFYYEVTDQQETNEVWEDH